MITIGSPSISADTNVAKYEIGINEDHLWYLIPKAFRGLLTDLADPAVLAVLYPAMLQGKAIHVSGPVSQKLFYNVSGPLQSALRSINPTLNLVHTSAERIVCPPSHGGVATGFSGGVDSFSVIKRHYLDVSPKGYRITHLTLHDIWNAENFMDFRLPSIPKGMRQVKLLAEKWGLPLVTVSSNVGSFYRNVRFEDTHTLRNASAAHVLAAGIGRYIYASAYPMRLQTLQKVSDMARADLILLPMMSSEAIDCISGDPDCSRLEKTIRICSVPEAMEYLHVCAAGWDKNCSRCWKCRRTMLTLKVIGKLDMYSRVFDVEAFRRDQHEWLKSSLGSPDPFIAEIMDYAKINGIDLGAAS
jgi:hypothetical protein